MSKLPYTNLRKQIMSRPWTDPRHYTNCLHPLALQHLKRPIEKYRYALIDTYIYSLLEHSDEGALSVHEDRRERSIEVVLNGWLPEFGYFDVNCKLWEMRRWNKEIVESGEVLIPMIHLMDLIPYVGIAFPKGREVLARAYRDNPLDCVNVLIANPCSGADERAA